MNFFACPKCAKIVPTKENLALHEKTFCGTLPENDAYIGSNETLPSSNSEPQTLSKCFPFVCSLCGLACSQLEELKTHNSKEHKTPAPEAIAEKKVPVFDCKLCTRSYKSEYTVWRHIKTWHKEDLILVKSLSAPLDSQEVSQDSSKGAKPAMSPSAEPSASPREAQKAQATTTLSQKNDHSCDVCDKNFNCNSNLRRHQRGIHKMFLSQPKEAIYSCSFCVAKYSKLGNLERHEKVAHNSSSRPWKSPICSRCDISLCSKYYYKRHMRIIHGENV